MATAPLRRIVIEDTLKISGDAFRGSSLQQVRLVKIVQKDHGEAAYLLQIGSNRLMIESDYSIFPCPFGCESPLLTSPSSVNHSHGSAYSPSNLLSGSDKNILRLRTKNGCIDMKFDHFTEDPKNSSSRYHQWQVTLSEAIAFVICNDAYRPLGEQLRLSESWIHDALTHIDRLLPQSHLMISRGKYLLNMREQMTEFLRRLQTGGVPFISIGEIESLLRGIHQSKDQALFADSDVSRIQRIKDSLNLVNSQQRRSSNGNPMADIDRVLMELQDWSFEESSFENSSVASSAMSPASSLHSQGHLSTLSLDTNVFVDAQITSDAVAMCVVTPVGKENHIPLSNNILPTTTTHKSPLSERKYDDSKCVQDGKDIESATVFAIATPLGKVKKKGKGAKENTQKRDNNQKRSDPESEMDGIDVDTDISMLRYTRIGLILLLALVVVLFLNMCFMYQAHYRQQMLFSQMAYARENKVPRRTFAYASPFVSPQSMQQQKQRRRSLNLFNGCKEIVTGARNALERAGKFIISQATVAIRSAQTQRRQKLKEARQYRDVLIHASVDLLLQKVNQTR